MRLSVLINSSVFSFFSCSRGVHKGDQLSPLLFCLAEELFSRGISYLFTARIAKPITTPTVMLTHILYTDDVFIFCRGDTYTIMAIFLYLRAMVLPQAKRLMETRVLCFLGGSAIDRKDAILSNIGFHQSQFHFVYLGVLIFHGIPRKAHFQSLADRAKARLAS